MSFQFPANPNIGDTVINPTSSINFTWDGVKWASTPTSASFSITSSYTEASQVAYQIGNKVFTNGNLEFSWYSPIHGNPTASGAIITGNGNTQFITTNNYDGVRLTNTAAGSNRSGSVYWLNSTIDFDSPQGIWCTWNTKNNDGFFGPILSINSVNPPTGSLIGDVTSSGVSIFFDDGAENIKISNNGLLLSTITPIGGGIQDNTIIQWDAVFYKSESNYYLNLYQSWIIDVPVVGGDFAYGLGKTFPYPIPVSTANNNITTINLGTTMPTGEFLGFYCRSGLTTSTIDAFVNKLQVRSAELAPLVLGPTGRNYGFQ